MKVAETTTTTATPARSTPVNTPFFSKEDSGDTDHFFQRSPVIQAKPDTPPSTGTPSAITTPTASTISPEVVAIRAQAKTDAVRIKNILTDNSWLTGGDQGEIMAIVWPWTIKMPVTGTRLSPFDYLVVALQNQTFTIGTLTTQWTSAFDQMMHRMDDGRVATFNVWMKTFGKGFRDEKAHDEVKFEVKKEHLVQGLEMVGDVAAAGAELAAAGLTGGASELAILAKWLVDTLPELYSSAKTIIGLVDTIRSLKKDDLQKLFSAGGMGNVLVKSLFGELQGLPVPAGEEEKEEKEGGGNRGEKGFMKMLNSIKRVITSLVSAYKKLAGFVNSTLGALDLTRKDWFDNFSMAYAGIMTTVEAAMNPGDAITKATGALRDVASGFFENVKGKMDEVVAGIKDRLQVITQPARMLKTIADKAVEWVLNFIITHPPSRLFKLLGKLITSLSGKSIVELLREKVSFADDIIKKIADSGPVQKLISPLNAPVHGITTMVDSIAGKAGAFIGNMETRTLAFMGNGEAFIKEMMGVKDTPAGSTHTSEDTAAATPGDTIGAIKSGIHHRLMTIGGRLLVEKGKQIGKTAVEKGKTAALDWWNKKVKFKSVDGQDHTLFFNGEGKNSQLMVATTPMLISSVLTQVQNRPEILDKNSAQHAAHQKALKIVADATKLISTLQSTGTKGYDYKDIDKLNKWMENLSDAMEILVPLISTAPPVGRTDIKVGDLYKKSNNFRYLLVNLDTAQDLVWLKNISSDKSTRNEAKRTSLFIAAIHSGEYKPISGLDKRDEYMGKLDKTTYDKVWDAVVARMIFMGKYKEDKKEFFNSRPPKTGWFHEDQADLGHIVDAAVWWNAHGRFFGPHSPQVKAFMEDPANYELEEHIQNVTRGSQVVEYLPPVY